MVSTQIQDTSNNVIDMSFFTQLIQFFKDTWGYLLFFLVALVLGIIIYVLYMRYEEALKFKDKPHYAVYKMTKRDCRMQARRNKIKKSWHWINLLWLGIPIIKKEHSAKLIDQSGRTLGYYRGEMPGMDNTYNYLVYKSKFLWIEKTFIIKIPISLKVKSQVDDNGKEKLIEEIIPLNDYVKEFPNGDIRIQCLGLNTIGHYYSSPVFATDKNTLLDYRKVMEGIIVDNTWQRMVGEIVSESQNSVKSAMMHNPHLMFARLTEQKNAEEQRREKETPS